MLNSLEKYGDTLETRTNLFGVFSRLRAIGFCAFDKTEHDPLVISEGLEIDILQDDQGVDDAALVR